MKNHHIKLFSLQLCYELILSILITFIVGLLLYYIVIEPNAKVVIKEIEKSQIYPALVHPGDELKINKKIFKYHSCPGEIVTTIRCGNWRYSFPTVAENFEEGFSVATEHYTIPQSIPHARSCVLLQTYWHKCNLIPIRFKAEPLLFVTDFFSLDSVNKQQTSTDVLCTRYNCEGHAGY